MGRATGPHQGACNQQPRNKEGADDDVRGPPRFATPGRPAAGVFRPAGCASFPPVGRVTLSPFLESYRRWRSSGQLLAAPRRPRGPLRSR